MLRSSIALLVAFALFGCASRGSQDYDRGPAGPLRAVLRPYSSPLSGEATTEPGERPGTFRIKLHILGSQAGQQHPWHVHSGRCDQPDNIVGSVINYQPLNIRGDGQFNLEITIDGNLERGRAYHVDIHASTTQMDRIIACGDLLPQTM